jgi:hypothetical protein
MTALFDMLHGPSIVTTLLLLLALPFALCLLAVLVAAFFVYVGLVMKMFFMLVEKIFPSIKGGKR